MVIHRTQILEIWEIYDNFELPFSPFVLAVRSFLQVTKQISLQYTTNTQGFVKTHRILRGLKIDHKDGTPQGKIKIRRL